MKCLMEDCPNCYWDRMDDIYKCHESLEEVDEDYNCDYIDEED